MKEAIRNETLANEKLASAEKAYKDLKLVHEETLGMLKDRDARLGN